MGDYVKLTPKQQAFCDYYIETANATQSYWKAGYKAKNENIASVEGFKLLRNPKIKQYIELRMATKEEHRIASQDEILEFLTKVLRNEETEEIPVSMTNKFEMVDKKPSIKDRTKAAELLGRRHALFIENQNNGDTKRRVVIVNDLGELDD